MYQSGAFLFLFFPPTKDNKTYTFRGGKIGFWRAVASIGAAAPVYKGVRPNLYGRPP